MKNKRKRFIELESDNFNGQLCTPRAYKALTLQMSTGDFHSHKKRTVFLTQRQIDKRMDAIIWHVTVKEALRTYIDDLKQNINHEFSFNEFLNQYETDSHYILVS